MNLSLLGAILAIFQFCWFSGLFWPFFHCKIGYFCKIRLSDLAQDESSDCDSENCSEISAVTWFRIYPRLLQIPTLIFFTPPYYRYIAIYSQYSYAYQMLQNCLLLVMMTIKFVPWRVSPCINQVGFVWSPLQESVAFDSQTETVISNSAKNFQNNLVTVEID